jgi:hypothetical protein
MIAKATNVTHMNITVRVEGEKVLRKIKNTEAPTMVAKVLRVLHVKNGMVDFLACDRACFF